MSDDERRDKIVAEVCAACQKIRHEQPFPFRDCSVTLEGYEFQGWSTVRNDALAKSVLSFDENGKSLMPIDRDGTVYALWAKMGTVVKPPTSTSDSTTQSQIGAYSNTETGLNGLAMFEAVVRQPGKFPNTDFGSITEESTPWVN